MCLAARPIPGGRGALRIKPCTGLRWEEGPPHHWHWHSRDEMFFPFEGPSGRSLKSTKIGMRACLVRKGRTVQFQEGSCPDPGSGKRSPGLLEFDLAGFDRTRVFDRTMKAIFRTGDSKCLTAVPKSGAVELHGCNAAKNNRQQFIVSYGGDGSVLELPNPVRSLERCLLVFVRGLWVRLLLSLAGDDPHSWRLLACCAVAV